MAHDHHKTRPHRAEMSVAGIDDTKGAESVTAGALLEVHCTDPLSAIDIPDLIQEVGGTIEITEQGERRIIFLIEKADGSPDAATMSALPDQDRKTRFFAPQQCR